MVAAVGPLVYFATRAYAVARLVESLAAVQPTVAAQGRAEEAGSW